MKRLFGIMLVALMITSCSYDYNLSVYQNKNIKQFHSKKRTTRYRHKYIRPGRRGYINHRAVTGDTRRSLKRQIKADRWTVTAD